MITNKTLVDLYSVQYSNVVNKYVIEFPYEGKLICKHISSSTTVMQLNQDIQSKLVWEREYSPMVTGKSCKIHKQIPLQDAIDIVSMEELLSSSHLRKPR